MRTLTHIILGAAVALATLSMPWLLAVVVILQSATAKAQYDIYHADYTDTQPRLYDIILMLLAGFVTLLIARLYI